MTKSNNTNIKNINLIHKEICKKIQHVISSVIIILFTSPYKVYAATAHDKMLKGLGVAANEGDEVEAVSASAAISYVAGLVLQVAIWVGTVIFLWGIVTFAFSIKNDDPEAKQKSIYIIVTGIVLICLKTVFDTILI